MQLFLAFFALERDFLEAAFLKEVPCEIAVFVGRGVQETLRKGVPRGSKNGPRTRHEKVAFWGSVLEHFWAPWAPLGPILEHLSCRLLAPEAHKGRTKGGPREAKRGPREPKGAQERPKRCPSEAEGEPKVLRRAKERPKRAPDSLKRAQDRPREFQREPKTATEPRLQRGGSGGSFPPALYKQGQDNLALRRASLFIVLFASVFAILHVFAVPCLLLRRAVCCALHCLAVLRCTDLRCTSYGSLRCSCFAASLNYLLLSFAKYTYLCYIYISICTSCCSIQSI